MLKAAGLTLIAVALTTLSGWYFHIEELTYIIRGFSTMKTNTAWLFLLFGTAVLFTKKSKNISTCLSLIGIGLSAYSFLEYLFNIPVIDDILFHAQIPNRPAPQTLICFFTMGIAMVYCSRKAYLRTLQVSLVLLMLNVANMYDSLINAIISTNQSELMLNGVALGSIFCFLIAGSALSMEANQELKKTCVLVHGSPSEELQNMRRHLDEHENANLSSLKKYLDLSDAHRPNFDPHKMHQG